MKFLFDLFPVILFFVAFKFAGIYVATVVAMVATLGQIGWVWFRRRKVDTMLWVSFAVVTVFGGATLWLHDETFIKWKPTVLYWLFAGSLLVSSIMGKNLIRALMEAQLKLPHPVWQRLNASWVGFFTLMGFANLYVAYRFPTDIWVNFKLFGGMGAMLLFVLAQGLFLSKFIDEEKS